MEHQGVHKNSFRNTSAFQDRIGTWICWFLRRGETGVSGEKPLRAEKKTKNELNPHMMLGQGIECGTHWLEASTLTTAPCLLLVSAESNSQKCICTCEQGIVCMHTNLN